VNRSRARRPAIERALRRPWWRRGLSWVGQRWLSLANAAALVMLGIGLLRSPQFRVEQVVVRRESASAQAAVTRATQLSQVVGYNIFLINTSVVADEVASIPSVRSVRVIPRFPNVVEIELVERTPIATWTTNNGQFLVDDQGVIVGDAPEPAAGALDLQVRDTTGQELHLGDRVHQMSLLAARELKGALETLGANVQGVEISPLGIELVTEAGCRVIFGGPESLNAKVAAFAAISDLTRSRGLRLELIDLRPKDRPYYRVAA
jgi:cell division protein FtsQ